jgi:sulfur-oxidizing protein SoxA
VKSKTLVLAGALAAVIGGAQIAGADPVEDSLYIDGLEMITRTTAPDGHPMDEVMSGWLFRTTETRALETDSFENPGMIGVDDGETIWNTVEGAAGKSCASCHGDAAESMKGVGANYPKWNEAAGKPYNLELLINDHRVEKMQAEPYKFDAGAQKALVAYIKHQSLGMPVKLDLAAGDMQSWWETGKEKYYERTGQLNLSCASCHEVNMGKNIRADHLSQGQINGFPTYRLKQGALVSVHNRFRGCIRDTRAEYPAAFSDVLMALEVYVSWRGTGLSVETPAVRQ